jgi:hypothetical protein
MKKNDFEDFAGTSAGRRAASLLRDHQVKPEQIFATVLAEVTENLPHLEESCRYTTEILCGPDLWANWLTAERRVAGMCVAYIAKKPDVALYKHRTQSGAGKAKYRNTPPPEPLRSRSRIVRRRRRAAVRGESAGGVTCQ